MTVRDQAVKYAQIGWHVFPCRAGGKEPLTKHGLLEATANQDQVARIFSRSPTANIGVRTGACSRIVVLDIDGDEGYDSLHTLEHRHGSLPATASVKTPRGGQHFYFQHPGGVVPNSASQVGPHVDVRGDGGYVIAPPSMGANGHPYEPDERAPVSVLPPWLYRLIAQPQQQRADRSTMPAAGARWGQLIRAGLKEGERNMGLTKLVGHLLAKDVNAYVALELLLAVNHARCKPPLDDRDVQRIVESISGMELRKTGAR